MQPAPSSPDPSWAPSWPAMITTSSASARPTRVERGDRERRLPASAGPEQQRPHASTRTMAAPWRMKRSWRASNHVSGRYTQPFEGGRSTARSGTSASARSPATVITRPGGHGDDHPVGFGPELEARAAPSAAVETGGRRGRRIHRDRGPRGLGSGGARSRGSPGEAGRARRPPPATQRTLRRCRQLGRARAAEGSLTVSDRRTHTVRAPASAAPVDPFPGLSPVTLQAAFGAHPVGLRHAFADDPRFAPEAIAPFVGGLPRSSRMPGRGTPSTRPTSHAGTRRSRWTSTSSARSAHSPTSPASIRAYNLEHTAEFRELDAEVERTGARPWSESAEGGVVTMNLGVFMASPRCHDARAPRPSPQPAAQDLGEERGVGRGRSGPPRPSSPA